jgi:hypothetical protein
MYHLWWPKWQWDWFLSDYFWCTCQYLATTPVSILTPHLSVSCHHTCQYLGQRTCQYLANAPVIILPPHLSVSCHRTSQYLATAPVSILPQHLSVFCHSTCQYLATAPVSILPPHLSVSCHQFSILVNTPLTKSAFCSQTIAPLNKTLKAWLLMVSSPYQWPRCQRGGYTVACLLELRVRIAPGAMDICLLRVLCVIR